MKDIDTQGDAQRILDRLLVLLSAPLWLPLIACIAALVWLDDPKARVVYSQTRVGRNGKPFSMWKFRSMVADADTLKEQLREYNERIWPDFKMTNDPRITRVGKWLRKSSLDELPQIFNVIAGDMSLIGPRPTSFLLSSYDVWHTERLEVRPGMTGFWQVKSRRSEFDERVRMDILHVRHFSIVDAMKILLFTIPAALKGQ